MTGIEFLVLSGAILVAIAAYNTIRAILKFGIKNSIKALFGILKSPKKAFRAFKSKRAEKKLIKENRTYWVVGQEFDKIDALARYKKDERVINSAEVKNFELARKNKANKKAIKSNKRQAKSKSAKQFNKITK